MVVTGSSTASTMGGSLTTKASGSVVGYSMAAGIYQVDYYHLDELS